MTTRKASTTTEWCMKMWRMGRTVVDRWRVFSDSGRTYTVSALKSHTFRTVRYECSCRGWTMHVPRRDCKHIRHVKNYCN